MNRENNVPSIGDGYFTGLQMDFERIAAKQRLQKELKKIIPIKVA
jgi:hypothetical protein